MWKNQSHFFGAAAIAIRRILVENARRKKSLKRGGGGHRELMEEEIPDPQSDPIEDIVALDDALTKLAQINPQAAQFVELHYFSGVPRIQAAKMLSISSRSADRLWAYARAWLRREMSSCED
jgi:RNA polymerase sigma factor (TIGR02999 family)